MSKLLYSAIASLDLYVEDADGGFEWAVPSDEMMTVINDLERPIGTYLYGRRMYETMRYWETAPDEEFTRIWRAASKVVFSRTLASAPTPRTRIERAFDPSRVRELKSAAESDLSVGGADLAGQALRAGLVDELQLFLVPVIVGGGKRALPDGVRVSLELLDLHRFADGAVYLRYRCG